MTGAEDSQAIHHRLLGYAVRLAIILFLATGFTMGFMLLVGP